MAGDVMRPNIKGYYRAHAIMNQFKMIGSKPHGWAAVEKLTGAKLERPAGG